MWLCVSIQWSSFGPVAAFYRASYVMVVNRSFPARTASEVIAYAKANPGKVNFGSQGVGAT